VITGASSGIGAAIASELAAGGTNLVLTARREARLKELAATVRAQHQVRVEICTADLEQPSAPDAIFQFTRDRNLETELLVNNAGFGYYQEFAPGELARELAMVQVNISAVVHLTHLFLQPMIARRSGDILILASTAAFQPVPYIAVYSATKGFDLLFAEALAEEVLKYGIHVCALCPGSTETEFQQVAGEARALARGRETAEKVAHVGLRALAKGRSSVISGFNNNLLMELQRIAPRRLVARVTARMFRPERPNRRP
jgi:uncharacterized protein